MAGVGTTWTLRFCSTQNLCSVIQVPGVLSLTQVLPMRKEGTATASLDLQGWLNCIACRVVSQRREITMWEGRTQVMISEHSVFHACVAFVLCQHTEFKKKLGNYESVVAENSKLSELWALQSAQHLSGLPDVAQASDDLTCGACEAARPAIKSIRQFPKKLCLTTSKCQDPQSKQSGKHFMAHSPWARCDTAALFLFFIPYSMAAGNSDGRVKSMFPSHRSSIAQLSSASMWWGFRWCFFFPPEC